MTGRAKTDIGRLVQGGIGGRKKTRANIGRHSLLTPEVSKRICDAVKAGNYLSVAAQYAGVASETLHLWVRKGTDGGGGVRNHIYLNFVRDLAEAEAAAEVAAVLHWRAAMPKDWHSSETWLKRRAPERWAEAKDPSAPSAAAFAGINLTINQGASEGGRPAIDRPLSELLEANPELISGTMQFLDQLLPVEAVNGVIEHELEQNLAEEGSEASKAAIEALRYVETSKTEQVETVLDAEVGSWREIEHEADRFDA